MCVLARIATAVLNPTIVARLRVLSPLACSLATKGTMHKVPFGYNHYAFLYFFFLFEQMFVNGYSEKFSRVCPIQVLRYH